MGKTDDKIFDNVFRTMLEKMPQLMIPLINEVFHTNYQKEDLKAQLKNEHHDAKTGENRTTDSLLHIGDKQYHIECQKKTDNTMAIRMFEYDVRIALGEARLAKKGRKEIKFPNSCILYLTHNKSVGEVVSIPVRFADGHVHEYKVPVLKAQDYLKEEIFQKDLYVLLPYYILRYEKRLKAFEGDEAKQEALLEEYEGIRRQLKNVTNPTLYNDLMDMVKAVLDYEMPEGSRLKERMDKVMGGEVLELYSERVLRLEREKGQNLSVDRLVKKLKMTEKEACELMDVDFENYKAYKESQKETKQEKEEDLPRRQTRRR